MIGKIYRVRPAVLFQPNADGVSGDRLVGWRRARQLATATDFALRESAETGLIGP